METDPQLLWVGPSSEAARDRAAYEAAFGPFYRITQVRGGGGRAYEAAFGPFYRITQVRGGVGVRG